jgi:hypothetical protein
MTLREIQQTAEKLAWDLLINATGYFTLRVDCKEIGRVESVHLRERKIMNHEEHEGSRRAG